MIKLKKENIATTKYPQYEILGTIAIDLANDIKHLIPILKIPNGWEFIGFKFNKFIFENIENIDVKIILKQINGSNYSYIIRNLNKNSLINILPNISIQISQQKEFYEDLINWEDLKDLE